MPKKIKKVCSTCGSENVLADAYAQWNVEKQDWELANVFDKNSYCGGKCDGECNIVDKEITKPRRIIKPAPKKGTIDGETIKRVIKEVVEKRTQNHKEKK